MRNPLESPIEQSTQRLEAFSDGVFAIAITLLILEIRVPHVGEGGEHTSLATALFQLWPSYGAYLLSFVMIGIYWVNHHAFMRLFTRTDHGFNLLHIFFLMCISFLPFPTAVLAEYLTNAEQWHTAVSLYALGLLLPAFSWFLVWLYGSYKYRLLDSRLDPTYIGFLNRQYLLSNGLYSLALLTSFWNTTVSLSICIGLTFLYLLPPRKPVFRKD